MARRIFLHIGSPKSGTTYLQTVLWANRDVLRERGVLVPGRVPFDLNRASIAVRRGLLDGPGGVPWHELVEEARRFDGDVVISHEWLLLAAKERAEAAIRSLGADAVHVVFTARNYLEQVPAGWQEALKLGRGWSLTEFLDLLDDPRDRWSWRVFDPALALPPWVGSIAPGRVHVVTVPAVGAAPGELWRRFARACDFDPEPSDTGSAQANQSLGAEAARWLQVVGPALREAVRADEGDWRVPYHWIRQVVSHELLVPLGGSGIALPEGAAAKLTARAAATSAFLSGSGYDVVGDLADLTTGVARPGSRNPEDVPGADLLGPARALTAGLLARLREEHERAERAERALARVSGGATAPGTRSVHPARRRARSRIARALGLARGPGEGARGAARGN